MKFKNNITTAWIDKEGNCLEQSSKKIKSKLLSLIQSGDMDSVIEKLEKKQKKLSEIYEEEWLSDNFLKKTKKWIKKVNLYLNHRGKAYLFEFWWWESHNRCITWVSIEDEKMIWQRVYPHQYENTNLQKRNKNPEKCEQHLESLFNLGLWKSIINVNH